MRVISEAECEIRSPIPDFPQPPELLCACHSEPGDHTGCVN